MGTRGALVGPADRSQFSENTKQKICTKMGLFFVQYFAHLVSNIMTTRLATAFRSFLFSVVLLPFASGAKQGCLPMQWASTVDLGVAHKPTRCYVNRLLPPKGASTRALKPREFAAPTVVSAAPPTLVALPLPSPEPSLQAPEGALQLHDDVSDVVLDILGDAGDTHLTASALLSLASPVLPPKPAPKPAAATENLPVARSLRLSPAAQPGNPDSESTVSVRRSRRLGRLPLEQADQFRKVSMANQLNVNWQSTLRKIKKPPYFLKGNYRVGGFYLAANRSNGPRRSMSTRQTQPFQVLGELPPEVGRSGKALPKLAIRFLGDPVEAVEWFFPFKEEVVGEFPCRLLRSSNISVE